MAFNPEQFAHRLLAECLFFDDEYGALGNVSLIDEENNQERFLATYDPDDEIYLIEEATDWEDLDVDEDGEIDYAVAVDGDEHGTYESPEEAAEELLRLAKEFNLQPSVMLLFEDDNA